MLTWFYGQFSLVASHNTAKITTEIMRLYKMYKIIRGAVQVSIKCAAENFILTCKKSTTMDNEKGFASLNGKMYINFWIRTLNSWVRDEPFKQNFVRR